MLATIRLFKLVKTIDLDALVPNGPINDLKAPEFVPNILEYLLVEYPTVVFIEIGNWISNGSMPTVIKAAEMHGEVLVPDKNLVSRSKRVNPAVQGTHFSLLAYTRSGFVQKIKPHLDCRRGFGCAGAELVGIPKSASILRRGYIGLHTVDPRIIPRMTALSTWKTNPYTESTFEYIHDGDLQLLNKSDCLKIGLGLESSPEEDGGRFITRRLVPLFESIEGQDRKDILVIIYIMNYSKDIVFKESLRRVALPSSIIVKVATDAAREADGFVKQITAMAALDDGCKQFHQFGLGSKVPHATTNWLKYFLQHGRFPFSSFTLVTSIKGEEDLWMLREVVGSIHGALTMKAMATPPRMIVVGTNLSRGNIEMIKLWQYVEYMDLGSLLFGSRVDHKLSLEMPAARLSALEAIIRRNGPTVWISPKIAIPDTAALEDLETRLFESGHVVAEMVIEGTNERVIEGYDPVVFERINGERLACVRGIKKCDSEGDDFAPDLKANGLLNGAQVFRLIPLLPKPDEDRRSQNYCHLTIRPEIMYNPIRFSTNFLSSWGRGVADSKILHDTTKTKIAFLIPSKNKPGSIPHSIHLIQNFLKSMLSSVNMDEWERFQYSIYIGYDRDDPVLDKRQEELQQIIQTLLESRKDSVLVKYHLLPTAKCITLLWNILFMDALRDGNDYFYQINDDVNMVTAGWSTSFVSKLRKNDDVGVVGPNDYLWKCRLLTQSFVSRKHHEIFNWYYPTEIKDWYSDNWITAVYGPERTQCDSNIFIKNSNSARRYNVCSEPRWQENVIEGQKRIAHWLRQTNLNALQELESGNSTARQHNGAE